MQNIIRIGDKTTGGGTVRAGSEQMVFSGIGAARKGDPVDCPLPGHGRTFISEGHPVFTEKGVPLAFHGHLCDCGCTLISSLREVSAS